MNRELKFRAWDKWNKKMEYSLDGWEDVDVLNLSELFAPFEDRYDLMQYTGLKDRTGREIYEGDVLERVNKVGVSKDYHFGKVQYERGEFVFLYSSETSTLRTLTEVGWRNYQVIGNIYENPELLETKTP